MFTTFFTFLKSPLAKYLGIIMLVSGGLFYVYHLGEEHVRAEWNLEKEKTKAEIARLKEEAGKITTNVIVEYVDKVKTVTVKGDTIVKYVDKYISSTSDAKCVIPNNFVLLHDRAVKNIVPAEGNKK